MASAGTGVLTSLRAAPAAAWTWLGGLTRRVAGLPGVRPALRWTGYLLLAIYFFFVILILLLRYWIFPGVAGYQADIEKAATQAIGMPVKIERIQASWDGLNPRLVLQNVRLQDRQGKPALAFKQVESVMSWQTVWRWKPILSLLAIEGPVLHVRRDVAGRITIAGIAAEGETDPRMADWLFEQRRIRIRNATIVWEDAKRNAPPLTLEKLQFGLDNRGQRHRFGLSAVPPSSLASRLDIRGDVRGNLLEGVDKLSGRVFAELDYADLAGWRAWVDYPIRLTQGRGALRVWGDWSEGKGGFTADVALEDVHVQLGRNVPALELASMRGRLGGGYQPEAWRFSGQRIELSTLAGGIRVPPTDFNVEWRQGKAAAFSGSAAANFVDFGAFERLAAYLPLDQRSRDLLATHQPRGRVTDLRVSWEADGERLKRYDAHARFDGLGMKAAGYFPGSVGLSGVVDATDKGGSLTLDAADASLDLPTVFPESRIPLGAIKAKANWKIENGVVDARLDQLEFAGADAAGKAHGRYRYDGQGPGVIDLAATLSRADGRSVWRYMPHVVSADAREWLKRGIVGGSASDARLTLKGDLRHFPFSDPAKGQFLITAKAHDVSLDYAPGWPAIAGIEADLSFGVGMRVVASRGAILGTRIATAVAEIPSFEAADEQLLVNGQVDGPTGEFLRFIELSPVAEHINHLTEDMRAQGDGKLALKLDIPLRRVKDTRVQGEYQFHNNQVIAVAGMPPVSQVNGTLAFTDRSVTAPEIRGQIFGAPMRLTVRNDGDRVFVAMAGGAVARELRKAVDHPVFDYLSGQTSWKGEVRVRRKTTEFHIESNLAGLSSSLPEPFNKAANASLPLRLEKTASGSGDGGHDQWHVVLRGVAEAQLVRQRQGGAMVIERGAVSVGAPLGALPARGVALNLQVPKLDADFWRRLAQSPAGEAEAATATSAPSPIARVAVKTPSLRLFGRDFNEVDATGVQRDGGWQISLAAREAAGDLHWQSAAKGEKAVLRADLARLVIPTELASGTVRDEATELMDSLPGLDVHVADFAIGNKRLGRLDAKAHNTQGVWHLDGLSLQNADGSLKGTGEWRSRGGHVTRLDFQLNSGDVGKLLDRLGFPGTVRRGSAALSGDLTWDGPLTAIHYPSLTGEIRMKAEKGQFAKIEPGIGKLVGLLSLQALPRRMTLDFNDIFSQGLAFDVIDAKVTVKKGIMRTDNLRIDNSAARIVMQGETDLKAETQDIVVIVQPEVGTVAAAGAVALAHPVAGIMTWLANKVLQNPLSKIFEFRYRITGTWADPKVEKLGIPLTPPTAPATR